MFKQKFIASVALAATLVLSAGLTGLAFAGKPKKSAKFTVRIENISDKEGQTAADGTKYPFALSPGLYIVSNGKTEIFRSGKKAGPELESQAEDGDPSLLAKRFAAKSGEGVFNTPVGASMPGPLLPGNSFEFSFTATEGQKLDLVAMFGQSNDLFYGPEKAIALFDADGKPVTGDVTAWFLLWDAGTEVNQAPGIGPDQAPRQKAKNTGAVEDVPVAPVKDGFTYPNTTDVLRITITAQ